GRLAHARLRALRHAVVSVPHAAPGGASCQRRVPDGEHGTRGVLAATSAASIRVIASSRGALWPRAGRDRFAAMAQLPDPRLGAVAEGTGGVWRVIDDSGEQHDAGLRGRLKKADGGKRADGSMRRDTIRSAARRMKLAVGDRVRVEPDDRGESWTITEILP